MKPHSLETITPTTAETLESLSPRHLSTLKVDLGAIAHNFLFLQSQIPDGHSSAVVKADAYGLGMRKVSPALESAGCRHFFVATIDEALELRPLIKSNLYVLGGMLPGTEGEFYANNLIPVLNDVGQIKRWGMFATQKNQQLPAIIHLDTGMWRLGLPPAEVAELAENLEWLKPVDLRYIMSHLACSDSPHHDKNRQQRISFDEALSRLPKTPASLANSHGIFLGKEYHYQMIRPGRSLYGLGARFLHTEGLRQALQVYARILQVSAIGKGQTIGYDAMYCVPRPTRIATIALGYADGYSRTLSNHGCVYINGHQAPIVGRVSMDLITVDVGEVPEHLAVPGAWAEIIGENISADDVALAAGTTSREISSKFGTRFHKIYTC